MPLTLPHLTEADPDTLGEGKLDPLGLATVADRLAELIGPQMTARMSRPRFVTAMAVCAAIVERLWDELSEDGASPQLAFEWQLVEGFARSDLSKDAFRGVPGITKARLARYQGVRMDAAGYLKTPTVFGFHGVYAPLARGLGIVDHNLMLGERGFELVETWESEQRMRGFLSDVSDSPGGRLRNYFESKTRQTLHEGRAAAPFARSVELAALLRPDGARKRERRQLMDWIAGVEQPVRAELAEALKKVVPSDSEAEALRAVWRQPGLSREIRYALDAIVAFERAARLAMTALEVVRFESWSRGPTRATPVAEIVSSSEVLGAVGAALPEAVREAERRLERVELSGELHAVLGTFAEPMDGTELVRRCLDRHTQVQGAKPPDGKRSWFEESPAGIRVRLGYELTEPPTMPDHEYLHPYRVRAMFSFLGDLS